MGITEFDQVKANAFIGAVPGVSPFNKIIYVDGTNGGDGNDGKSPSSAVASIGQAITIGAAGDTVVIAPGTYTITTAIVPKARMIFKAAIMVQREPTVSIASAIALPVTIDVDGVQFHGIEFIATDNAVTNLVDIAETTAVNGLTFNGCVFNGADKTTVVALNLDDGAVATTGLVVTNCLFRDLTGTHINVGVLGMPYAYIAYNQFAIDVASGTAIALADTSAFATGKGYVIEHNDFTGIDATKDEVGITVAGTEDTTGAGMIRNNYFAYLAAAAITIDKIGFSCIQNYYGDATGGLLVDVGT